MKRTIILTTILALMLTPVVLAQPNKAVKCEGTSMFYLDEWAWKGPITFPDGSVYEMVSYADPNPRFVGHPTDGSVPFPRHLEQFEETWEIRDGITVLASGYSSGIFSSDSWKFVINGKVEAAYGELAYLEGASMHTRGVAWVVDGVFNAASTTTFAGYAGK